MHVTHVEFQCPFAVVWYHQEDTCKARHAVSPAKRVRAIRAAMSRV